MQILEAVGDDIEGSREDGSNGAGPVSDVQVSGTVGVNLWKRELSGNQGDAQDPDSVLPSGGAMDYRDDDATWSRRRVGVPSGRGGYRL